MPYLQDGVYNEYAVEMGFARTIVLNEELIPQKQGIRVSVIEIISSSDILLQTSLGARIVKAGTIAKFEKEGINQFSLKVIKGAGKIYVNMGLNGCTEKEAIEYSIKMMN